MRVMINLGRKGCHTRELGWGQRHIKQELSSSCSLDGGRLSLGDGMYF